MRIKPLSVLTSIFFISSTSFSPVSANRIHPIFSPSPNDFSSAFEKSASAVDQSPHQPEIITTLEQHQVKKRKNSKKQILPYEILDQGRTMPKPALPDFIQYPSLSYGLIGGALASLAAALFVSSMNDTSSSAQDDTSANGTGGDGTDVGSADSTGRNNTDGTGKDGTDKTGGDGTDATGGNGTDGTGRDGGGTGEGDGTGENDGDSGYDGGGDYDSSGGNGSGSDDDSGDTGGNIFDDLSQNQWYTLEYVQDGALAAINTHTRYSQEEDGSIIVNPNGTGVRVSVVSTGVNSSHLEFQGKDIKGVNYVGASTDLDDNIGLGTHVASRILGNKNDASLNNPYFNDTRLSSQGVAYNADLAVFKITDTTPSSSLIGDHMGDIVTKSDEWGSIAITNTWSLANLIGSPLSATEVDASSITSWTGAGFIPAMQNADTLGIISVFPTGDNAQTQPNANAALGVYYPELADTVVGVTAVDNQGSILTNSNHCGIAMNQCLAAPGSSIIGADFEDNERYLLSGGSYIATAFVSGSIALIKSNFPEMTGPEILQLLKNTATDLGIAGVDEIYGHGMINLENARQPQGNITIHTSSTINGPSIPLSQTKIYGNKIIGATLQNSLMGTEIMVSDSYERGFQADLTALTVIKSDKSSSSSKQISAFVNSSFDMLELQSKYGFSIQRSGAQISDMAIWADASVFASPFAKLLETPTISYQSNIGFADLKFTATQDQKMSNYLSIEINKSLKNKAQIGVELGHFGEIGSMLGATTTGALNQNLATSTNFARLFANLSIHENLGFLASATLGNTNFNSNGILSSGHSINSHAFAIGAWKSDIFSDHDTLSIGLSKPLTIHNGKISLDLPVSMTPSDDQLRSTQIIRSNQIVSLQQTNSVTDFQIGYTTQFGNGKLNLGATYRDHSQFNDEYAIGAGWNLKF